MTPHSIFCFVFVSFPKLNTTTQIMATLGNCRTTKLDGLYSLRHKSEMTSGLAIQRGRIRVELPHQARNSIFFQFAVKFFSPNARRTHFRKTSINVS